MPSSPILRGHELLPERAVWRGADGQVPGPSVTGNVDRLSTEQRPDTVEQGESEESTPVLERGHHRCGQAVSERGLGDCCGQSSVGDSQFDDVHAGEGRAPSNDLMSVDVGLFTRPADDGAVVRALARDGEHFARLPAGTAEVAVVEGDGGEALLAEALGERRQSSRLDATDAVGHHHGGVGTTALRQVDPRFDHVTRRRRDLHGDALRDGVVGSRH